MGFSRHTYEILNGSLLGDGGLAATSGGVNSRLKIERNAQFRDYNLWLMAQMRDIPWESTSPRPGQHHDRRTDRTYYKSTIRTRRHLELSVLRELWYPDGEKKVVRDFVEEFWSDQALLVWAADDGSFFLVTQPRKRGPDRKQLRFKMATNGFGLEDVEWLAEFLSQKTGFHFHPANNGNGQYVIEMRLTEAPLFQQRLARFNPVLSLGRKFDDMGGCDNRT